MRLNISICAAVLLGLASGPHAEPISVQLEGSASATIKPSAAPQWRAKKSRRPWRPDFSRTRRGPPKGGRHSDFDVAY